MMMMMTRFIGGDIRVWNKDIPLAHCALAVETGVYIMVMMMMMMMMMMLVMTDYIGMSSASSSRRYRHHQNQHLIIVYRGTWL